jgi:alpha-mannosidase
LAAAFTARLQECQAWFETPFAAARRPADGQEVPALRWAAVGGPDGGIALLNDCKYGHSAKGCQLAITLIRSGYDPDAISDVGEHRFRYAFLPYVGEWCQAGVVRKAASFNQPLLATLGCAGEPAEGVFRPRVEGACSVLPSILKRARDGSGTIVRLYESSGRTSAARIAGLPASAAVWECSIVEDRLRRLPAEAGSAVLTFGPWEVKTLLVEH